MKHAFLTAAILACTVAGCTTVEQNLQNANSLLLSVQEVREVFQGNTVTAATGECFYWDASGTVKGKGAYGGVINGNWNITSDGRLCTSSWSAPEATGGCYKVYFDNSTHLRTLVDVNGELKYTVVNSVAGNPNNF